MGLDVPAPEILRARADALRAARRWFWDHGFVEIEAPALVRSPALEEHLEALPAGGAFLHTSPEFALKRVLASGLGRIFAITPCFRAEEWGPNHSVEFTMLEWYRVGVGFEGILEDCEALVCAAAAALGQTLPPFERLSYADAFQRHAGAAPPDDPIEADRLWVNDVEPKLENPTFILDYPADRCAFASVRGAFAERFELYWGGLELANAFTELLAPDELRERFAHNNAARILAGRAPYPVDERLVQAIGQHPRAGGIALGVDRLIMRLVGASDIRDVRVLG